MNDQFELSLISHQVEKIEIKQRSNDGYINATNLCKASNKKLNDYLRTDGTIAFIKELSTETGFPASELVIVVRGGHPSIQGTWVHPQVAVNLGQWASPKFAVLVSKWVFDWMNGLANKRGNLPYHVRRYLINRLKIPTSHFSILQEINFNLIAPLEDIGYIVPDSLMPDISQGKMVCKWLRGQGINPYKFPTYIHEFDDNKRPAVEARLYPNEILTKTRNYINNDWIKNRAIKYFQKRDPTAIPYLEKLILQIKSNEKTKLDSRL